MTERKYYIVKRPFAQKRIVYRQTIFSGKVKEEVIENDFDLYFYAESGAFYEFFSGCCLGKYEDVLLGDRKIHYHGYIDRLGEIDGHSVGSAEIIIPDTEYLSVRFYDYDGIKSSAEVTAEEFAQKIKPLLGRKDYIAERFTAFLHDEQIKKRDNDALKEKKEEEKKKREQSSKEFLDQIIKERL